MTGQVGHQRQTAPVGRQPGIAHQQQARRGLCAELLQRLSPGGATIDDAPIEHHAGQRTRPVDRRLQLQPEQHRPPPCLQGYGCRRWLMQLRRGRIGVTDALAFRRDPADHLHELGQMQVQPDPPPPQPPAHKAQRPQAQAQQHAIHQHTTDHPVCPEPAPGLIQPTGQPSARALARHTHQPDIGHAQTGQGRRHTAQQRHEILEHFGRQQSAFPDKIVTPHRKTDQQAGQRAHQKGQPQHMGHRPQPPALQTTARHHRKHRAGEPRHRAAHAPRSQPLPQPGEQATAPRAQPERQCPQQQAQHMHAQQPPQRPHHIHRTAAIAQHGQSRPQPTQREQHAQHGQRHLLPEHERRQCFGQTIALGQRPRPHPHPLIRAARCRARQRERLTHGSRAVRRQSLRIVPVSLGQADHVEIIHPPGQTCPPDAKKMQA